MKAYLITLRNGTVTQTFHLMRSNAKKARTAAQAYCPGWTIYKMHRVG